mmetsp:Transcript_16344/g.39914  ORF Transcript_16344/g.39914 Transcript_16344/m.39914 type:complete len:283 (+) Transcript_16344:38-886(+)
MLTPRLFLSGFLLVTALPLVEPAKLLSAYVGAVDFLSILFRPVTNCNPAEGFRSDGMPVTFDLSVDKSSIAADQFAITSNGQVILAKCATLEPADEPGEGHTVLLTGNFVFKESEDSLIIPTMVEVVQSASTGKDLMSENGTSLTGLSTTNIKLGSRDGPSLALAFWYPDLGTNGRVQVVFEGGVTTNEDGDLTDETLTHFFLIDGAGNRTNPIGFGDLGDGDNYLFLDLPADFNGVPVSVELEAGILFDPMNYPNPLTSVDVQEGVYNYTAIGETSAGKRI